MVDDEPRRGRAFSSKKTPAPGPERPPEPVPAIEESEPEEWEGGAPRSTISFYHAEGAPYLGDDGKVHARPPPEELEELRRRGPVIPSTIVKEIVESVVPIREEKKTSAAAPVRAAASRPESTLASPEEGWWRESGQGSRNVQELPSPRPKQKSDLSVAEELAYFVIKRVFREGIRIPIRKEGMADFDVIIKGKEIVIDVNRLFFDTPKLSVWRITFAYQGETLALFGRGVKGDLKVHPLRLVRFLFRAWLEKRRYDKQPPRETTG